MSRIITEETYAALIEHLSRDAAVALFQQLLLSKKTADGEGAEQVKSEQSEVEQ